MRRLLASSLVLAIYLGPGQMAQADPIPLLSNEGYIDASVGGINLPIYLPLNMNYSSGGGSIEFVGGSITPGSYGTPSNAYADQQYPVDGQFYLNLGAPAAGSTDSFDGPVLGITGQVTGSLTGPGAGGSPWRWSGGYSGTATSASVESFYSQDASQLPAPLLDILNHPDHFHISVFVGGGQANDLEVTLTFDPPSPSEVPEPTALATLIVGSVAMIVRRRMNRVLR
jgi:hypothetical protein